MIIDTKKGAFTLIELLVVVAIIAVLVAMLLPALQRARGDALAVACGVNSRQIGTAVVLYTNDMNGYFPAMWYANGRWNPTDEYPYHRGYRVELDPYLANVESVWRCPARKFPTRDDPTFWTYGRKCGSAYIYNLCLYHLWSPAEGRDIGYKKIERVENPSYTVGFAEYKWTYWIDCVSSPVHVWPNLFSDNISSRLGFPHPQESMNINFVDGHVERVVAGDVRPGMFHHTWTP